MTRPDPRLHAEQILLWVVCWPWNLVWTLIVHNPIRHMVQFVIVEIRATLDEISNGEFKEIERDLVDHEPLVKMAAPVLEPAPDPKPPELPARESEPVRVEAKPDEGPAERYVPVTVRQPQPPAEKPQPPESSTPAYVPPAAPAQFPVVPHPAPPTANDPWFVRRDDRKPPGGGDTAWLQDSWSDTP